MSSFERYKKLQMDFVNNRFEKIILGSQSPRRKELLAAMGLRFEQQSIGADESYPNDTAPSEIARYLSHKKALAFNRTLKEKELLITADTVVILDGQILEKPIDLADAEGILRRLSNATHKVISGVTLMTARNKHSFSTTTTVTFKPLSQEMIEYYLNNGNPLDKAGAYGIQEWIGQVGIEKINGCYYNVMGLPTSKLYDQLSNFVKL